MPLANHALQLGAEIRIAKHLQMGGEDGAVLFAELAGDGLAIAVDLLARGAHGRFEPFQLVFHRVARDESSRDAKALVVHDEGLTHGDAGRNRNSL